MAQVEKDSRQKEAVIKDQQDTLKDQQATLKDQHAVIKNLEVQVGQLARQLSKRPAGEFPGDTQKPSTEHAFAITTRSGKVLHQVEKATEEGVVENKSAENELKNSNYEKEKIKEGEKSEKKLPFPNVVLKKNLEKQFAKFVAMFRKLHVDIPFSEVLEKMPQYAKFMKEILSKKRRLSDMDEVVAD